LKEAGFRMVTLTNSPPNKAGKTPLENAGLADYFERQGPPAGWGSRGRPWAADSASWGCKSVAGWKRKKRTSRRTVSPKLVGVTRASDGPTTPWLDFGATASKTGTHRLSKRLIRLVWRAIPSSPSTLS
jgi:hypothetical protein